MCTLYKYLYFLHGFYCFNELNTCRYLFRTQLCPSWLSVNFTVTSLFLIASLQILLLPFPISVFNTCVKRLHLIHELYDLKCTYFIMLVKNAFGYYFKKYYIIDILGFY